MSTENNAQEEQEKADEIIGKAIKGKKPTPKENAELTRHLLGEDPEPEEDSEDKKD